MSFTMTKKTQSTYNRFIKSLSTQEKKDFDQEYKELALSEMLLAIVQNDDISVKQLAKEAGIFMENKDRLRTKHATLQKALGNIHEATSFRNQYKNSAVEMHFRHSEIQCFELSLIVLWQFFTDYLDSVHLVRVNFDAPDAIFQAAFRIGIMSEAEHQHLLEMIQARNLIPDTYQEEIAEQLSAQIPGYYTTMKTIVDRIKIN